MSASGLVAEAERVLAAAPREASRDLVKCWGESLKLVKERARTGRVLSAPSCVTEQSRAPEVSARLGDVPAGFAQSRRSLASDWSRSAPLFQPFTRSMRADPEFIVLMHEYGVWDYWLATGKRPDVCDTAEERDFPFCIKLREEQAAKPK